MLRTSSPSTTPRATFSATQRARLRGKLPVRGLPVPHPARRVHQDARARLSGKHMSSGERSMISAFQESVWPVKTTISERSSRSGVSTTPWRRRSTTASAKSSTAARTPPTRARAVPTGRARHRDALSHPLHRRHHS